MKKLLIIAIMALGAISLSAADVEITWTANPAAQNIIEYTVYEDVAGEFVVVDVVDSTASLITNIPAGVHTYVVTATNLLGESPYSAAVSTDIAATATAPQGVTITVIVP